MALHLVFQSSERTLTDAEADAARGQIVGALASELGGELRE
jgi:phenylalanyl-tRNA synthetase beta subunit